MFLIRAVAIKDSTDFTHETIFLMAEVKPFVKPFILRVIALSIIRQECFCCQQIGKMKLFEGLFFASLSLLGNSSLLMLSESPLDKSCSTLEEKHF